jgi:hypothetical protein
LKSKKYPTNLFLAVIGIGSTPPPPLLLAKKIKLIPATQREEGQRGKKGDRQLAERVEALTTTARKAWSSSFIYVL